MVSAFDIFRAKYSAGYEIENDFQSFSFGWIWSEQQLFCLFIECDTNSVSMFNVHTLVGSFQVFNGHEYDSKTVLIARLVSSTA